MLYLNVSVIKDFLLQIQIFSSIKVGSKEVLLSQKLQKRIEILKMEHTSRQSSVVHAAATFSVSLIGLT